DAKQENANQLFADSDLAKKFGISCCLEYHFEDLEVELRFNDNGSPDNRRNYNPP
ncbi:hypothetical protein HAX54_004320, partial [Datura stramonium]|nr:hypothetical protein [Datura stramonium]